MWQLQWIFSLIPDAWLQIAVHVITALGIAMTLVGSLAKKFPIIDAYGIVIRSVGILVLLAGVFFEGGYATEMSWRARVNELQVKLKEAEVKSAQANEKLANEISKNEKLIKEKVNRNAKEIEAKRDAINAECKLSDDAWMLYNRAVEPKISRSSSSANGARFGSKATKRG